MNSPVIQLSTSSLRALASSLKTGVLSHGFSVSAIEQILGSAGDSIASFFEQLRTDGFSNVQMATLIDTVIETRESTPIPENVFELVLSGPDIPGIHTGDTAATMRSMIRESHQHILMVGYAVHNARELFKPIAEKLETTPGFTARFCLDISRSSGDTSLELEIVRRFTKEFSEKHWPWPTLPELYYDPRSLETGTTTGHSSLHAKKMHHCRS